MLFACLKESLRVHFKNLNTHSFQPSLFSVSLKRWLSRAWWQSFPLQPVSGQSLGLSMGLCWLHFRLFCWGAEKRNTLTLSSWAFWDPHTHSQTYLHCVWLVALSFCQGPMSGFIQDLHQPAIISRGIADTLAGSHSHSVCIICVYSPSISVPGALLYYWIWLKEHAEMLTRS